MRREINIGADFVGAFTVGAGFVAPVNVGAGFVAALVELIRPVDKLASSSIRDHVRKED
jgi:hypothetical protein